MKDTYVVNVQIVVQVQNYVSPKHGAAKEVGNLLNRLQEKGFILDWGPKNFVNGDEMNYIGKLDASKYQEGDYLKKTPQ